MEMAQATEPGLQSKKKKPQVHVETWGCQMNAADSEKMISLLNHYDVTDKVEDADLVILNTCHIREKANHKVRSRLGVLRELKEKKDGMVIAVTGCVAQAEGKKLLSDTPGIDVLLGPGRIKQLPNLLEEHFKTGKQVMALGFPSAKENLETEQEELCKYEAPSSLRGKNDVSRYVNIQQGCNNFCTFCVVPLTRGREISSTPEVIYQRAKALVASGAKEITLLGQNVNSYGLDLVETGVLPATARGPFVDLLYLISEIEGLQSLRFTTSNPHDLSEDVAFAFSQLKKLGKYIHLPVQSGSDNILEKMRRKVTAAEYLEKVSWLRKAVPDIAISTDIIVGFPGESDEDFQATLDLVEKVNYSFAYAFMYSPRKSTAAIRFKEQVPEEVKSARLAKLNALLDRLTLAHHERELGMEREVLVQYRSQKEEDVFYGKTEHFRLVRVRAGRDLVGQTVAVKITGFNKTALEGVLL